MALRLSRLRVKMPEMLVRLKKGKKTYEVMVNEGMVAKYREGKVTRLDDVVVAPMVFVNAGKGTKASADQLKGAFETDDVTAVIETILRTGEAQESAGERKEKSESKRHEIITAIQKGYVAPDGRPLPVLRIENALNQIKPRIDVDQDAERQVNAMHAKLSAVMPMKKSSGGMEGTVSVPAKLAGSVSSVIRKHATVQRETYGVQVKYDVEIHAYDLFMKELAKVTKGEYELTLASPTTGVASAASQAAPAAGGGKKKGKGRKK